VTLYKTKFFIKNVELRESELSGFQTNSDLGIQIADSDGIIDGLKNDNNIDHVIDHDGFLARIIDGNRSSQEIRDSKSLTVRNSLLVGRDYNWGDGIRFFGDGTNQVVIENNIFTGSPETPLPTRETFNQPLTRTPYGIHVTKGSFIIRGNTISGYPTAIHLGSGLSDGTITKATLSNNIVNNNGVGILTYSGGVGAIYDAGGGTFGSAGNNIFFNNIVYDLYHQNNATIYARYNDWHTDDPEELNERIYDRNDNPLSGDVILE